MSSFLRVMMNIMTECDYIYILFQWRTPRDFQRFTEKETNVNAKLLIKTFIILSTQGGCMTESWLCEG